LLKLIDRNVPRSLILLIRCWYDKVYITVKWNSSFSYYVKLNAGVRQGGILSPYLFAIFVDSVLIKLGNSNLGCHIGRMCFNSIMYADDLLLMAISLRDLQAMVNLCLDEFDCLDLNINIKKSMCLRIGNKHTENVASIFIKDQVLEWKQEIRYLGVWFVSAKNFKCSYQNARQKFFSALNGIFSKVGTKASPAVLLSLVNSYCLPVLLYGIEAIQINAKHRNGMENAYRTLFAKKFSTFDQSVILSCQFYCGVLPLSYIVDNRTFEFYKRLSTSCNECLKFHFLRSGERTYKFLQSKYNIFSLDNASNVKAKMWAHFEATFSVSNF